MSPTPRKSEEQIHYESLANYLKYVVGIAGALIVAVASVAIFFTYGDRQSMNEENDKLRTEFKNQMAESRSEMKSSYYAELERFDKNIAEMKTDAKTQQLYLGDRYDKQVEDLKQSSKDQLGSITLETRRAATEQTQKEIAAIFQTDRIQKVIEQHAIGELKDKLPATLSVYVKEYPRIIEAATMMKAYLPTGEKKLKGFFNSESIFERNTSRSVYTQIIEELFAPMYAVNKDSIWIKASEADVGVKSQLHKIIDNKYPTNPQDVNNLESLIKVLKSKGDDNSLYQFAWAYVALSYISGRAFEIFNSEPVFKWYDALSKK